MDVKQLIDLQASQIARLGTAPPVIAIAARAQAAAPAQRLDAVIDVARVDYVASQGVETPEGLRLSPRTFEDPDETSLGVQVSFEVDEGRVFNNGTIVVVKEAG